MTRARAGKNGPPPPKKGRGGLVFLGLLAVLLAVLVVWLVRSKDERTPKEAKATKSQPVSLPSHWARPVGSHASEDPPEARPFDRPYDPAEEERKGGVMTDLAPGPSAPPPFPRESQPLTEASDPELTVPEDDPVDAEKGIHVVWGPRKHVVHPPDPLVIDLVVLDAKGNRLPVTDAVARFRGEASTPEGPWFSESFRDGDNGAFVASHSPDPNEQQALMKGGVHVFVEVAFTAPMGLGPRKYGSAMMYSRKPGGTLNGKYDDAIVDGSLVINAGVTVETPSKYRLIASLTAADGKTALAFANQTATLSQGEQQIPLMFFGKILYDRGINGPYRLRYLMLFEQPRDGEEYPGSTVDDAYTTKPYNWRDFSPKPYVPPPPDYEVVDMNSPSQRDKPPPVMEHAQRQAERSKPQGGAPPPPIDQQGPPKGTGGPK